jgi:hypothetical protein
VEKLACYLSEIFTLGGYLFSFGLAPADFCVFSKVKTALKGRTLHDVQGIKHVTPELNAVPLDTFDDFFV